MATLSPINGLSLPALTDTPNIFTAVATGLSALDSRVNPVFSSVAARTSAIPSPSEGMECYVTATKEKYIYNGANWVSLVPRKIVLTTNQTVTDSTTLTNATQFVVSVEANSFYLAEGVICWTNIDATETNDFKVDWTFPASASVDWSFHCHSSASTNAVDGIGTQRVSGSVAGVASAIHGVKQSTSFDLYCITAGTAGNLQFRFAENVAAAGVTSTTLNTGTIMNIWKVS